MGKKDGLSGLLAAGAILLAAATAQANNAAEIATDEYCQCTTCGNALGAGFPLQTYDARAVKTSSGRVTFQCHFDIPEGYQPAKAMRPQSPGCGTPFGLSNKTHIVLTPGGTGKLTCQVNPSGD
ncbi:MAG: hypothetical protein R3229_16605 [Alphaproteobacteria bacterium]|nr:hypothetical protein [Alphaproteobacteria bacterium]